MTAAGLGFLFSIILIFLRVPIAAALAVTGYIGFGLLVGWQPAATMVAMTARDAAMSYTLAVVPLFILMGNLISRTGISDELYKAAGAFLGGRKGGLASATIVACGGFAMVCGSSVATVVTMGKVSLPAMREAGYADRLTTATVAAGATLGIIIPPSVMLVIYGIITETHIGKLYAAALVPGILGILGYIIAVKWTVWRDPSTAPILAPAPWSERFVALRRVWPVLVLFGAVLGGIYSGVFTATEAAGIGATGAFFLAIVRKRLDFSIFYGVLVDTARTTAVMFGLFIGAVIFTEFLNYSGAHAGLLAFVQGNGFSPYTVIAIICVIYLILGALMEELSMLLLTVPLFFPVVTGLGFDPVWFGILVIVLCEVGLIAPPLGINLFIVKSVAQNVSFKTIVQGISPFVAIDVIRVALIATLPIISLYLPQLFFS